MSSDHLRCRSGHVDAIRQQAALLQRVAHPDVEGVVALRTPAGTAPADAGAAPSGADDPANESRYAEPTIDLAAPGGADAVADGGTEAVAELVTELGAGVELDHAGARPPSAVLRTLVTVTAVVAHLHRHDVAHRALRPAAIRLRAPDERALLHGFEHARYPANDDDRAADSRAIGALARQLLASFDDEQSSMEERELCLRVLAAVESTASSTPPAPGTLLLRLRALQQTEGVRAPRPASGRRWQPGSRAPWRTTAFLAVMVLAVASCILIPARQRHHAAAAPPTTTTVPASCVDGTSPSDRNAQEASPCAVGTVIGADGTATVDGERYEVGRPGDLVLTGAWACASERTFVLARPTTGDLFTFAPAATIGSSATGRLLAHVAGLRSIRRTHDGCDQLQAVTDEATRTIEVSP